MGNVPPDTTVGDGSVVCGATDTNGNAIYNQPMAVGYGAHAGPGGISIGAFSGGSGGATKPTAASTASNAEKPASSSRASSQHDPGDWDGTQTHPDTSEGASR